MGCLLRNGNGKGDLRHSHLGCRREEQWGIFEMDKSKAAGMEKNTAVGMIAGAGAEYEGTSKGWYL